MSDIKNEIRYRRNRRKAAERQTKHIARLAPLLADLTQHFRRRDQDARDLFAARLATLRHAIKSNHRLRVAMPRRPPSPCSTTHRPTRLRKTRATHVYPRACRKPTAAKPWPLRAENSPPIRSIVSFHDSIAAVRLFNCEDPPAAIGPSLCADSGASKSLNRRSTATALGLPHAGPSDTCIRMASGHIKQAVSKTVMPFDVAPAARAGEVLDDDDLTDNLAAIKPFADSGHVTIFHPGDEGVTIVRSEDVNIVFKAPPVVSGYRDASGSKMWRLPYRQTHGTRSGFGYAAAALATDALQHSLDALHGDAAESANNVYDLPSIEQSIHWMHASLGYPAAVTWLAACRHGNLIGFPFSDVKYIRKFYPETDETPAGHLNMQRQNVRSTKPKAQPFEQVDSTALRGRKERDVYIKVFEAKNTIFSDQTGRFPVTSNSGNKYIMLMVEIDSNAVLVEPMSSRTDKQMQRAYLALLERIKEAGVVPKKHVLDNECSAAMKKLIRETCKLELVPPYCHRRNIAEVQIKNFKSHFISVLAGVDPDFPIHLWDKLLPGAETQFNILRQSNMTPTVSAYAHLFGPFDFNRMPLSPLGCAVNIHIPPDLRASWGVHTRPGWYLGCSPEHYRSHRCVDASTRRDCVAPTVVFKHKRITNPEVSVGDKVVHAVNSLSSALHKLVRTHKTSDPSEGMRQLQTLAAAVKPIVERHRAAAGVPANDEVARPRVASISRHVQSPGIPPPRVPTVRHPGLTASSVTGAFAGHGTGFRLPALPTRPRTATGSEAGGNAPLAPRPPAATTAAPPAPRRQPPPPLVTSHGIVKQESIEQRKAAIAVLPPVGSHRGAAGARRELKHLGNIAAPSPRRTRSQSSPTRSVGDRLSDALLSEHAFDTRAEATKQYLDKLRVVANAVLDVDSGKMLEYRQLLKHPTMKNDWAHSSANEFGRLFQGIGGRIAKPTNTCFFIHKHEVPQDRFKEVTYGKFVCSVRPQKAEPFRTRLTLGGNRITYPGDVGTPTADMLLFKILLNSVVSTPGAKFMTIDISNFYLNTPMQRYEYVKLALRDIPEEVISEYHLHDKAVDGHVYVEVRKGMYGLPQAGILAQELLAKRLEAHDYYQSPLVHGLWLHKWRPIQFSLVVDDFGVKYVGEEHAQHLVDVLKSHYKITEDWEGEKYIGIDIEWDYAKRQVHLSMPDYIRKALVELGYTPSGRRQDSPHPHLPVKYGAKQQFASGPDGAPPLDKDGIKFIQQVIGKFLYLARGVDCTILPALSSLSSQQAAPTETTMQRAQQLLHYLATQDEAILTYSASDMILAVHSDAGYLNEPNARSRAGGHFFLSKDVQHPPNNGAILNIAKIIKNVMSSAAEAELGGLYIMAREAIWMRVILEELGHKQPPTPIQTDNSTAEGIINNTVQPKQTKAMDMRFHWLRDRNLRKLLRFYWRPGTLNFADYMTKHHAPAHHRNVRDEFLTPKANLLALRKAKLATKAFLAAQAIVIHNNT